MDLLKKALVGAVIAIFIIATLFIVVIMIEIINEHYRHAAAVAVMIIGAHKKTRPDTLALRFNSLSDLGVAAPPAVAVALGT